MIFPGQDRMEIGKGINIEGSLKKILKNID